MLLSDRNRNCDRIRDEKSGLTVEGNDHGFADIALVRQAQLFFYLYFFQYLPPPH